VVHPDWIGKTAGIDSELYLRHLLSIIADHPIHRIETKLSCTSDIVRFLLQCFPHQPHSDNPDHLPGAVMKKSVLIVAVVLLSLAFVSGRTSAQAPAASNDVNAALIRELHDLRLAIEKLATASSRVQVLSTRASQQEQRISNLTTQLVALNGKLAESAVDTSIANARLQQFKELLRVETDPQKRAELEQAQAGFEVDASRKGLMQSSLQAQVDAIRQQIATEQSNLADLERRLDELDRQTPDPQR